MKRLLGALLTGVLLLSAVSAFAQVGPTPQIITKKAKWATWINVVSTANPRAIIESSSSDTTTFTGADATDTTAAIFIGDYAFGSSGHTVGPGGTTAMNALKVMIVADGIADDVDSVYYQIDHSPDGLHWAGVSATAAYQNSWTGVIAGTDPESGVVGGSVARNCISFFVKADMDIADGTVIATGAPVHWAWAPFIRIRIKMDDTSTNEFKAAQLYIAYPGYRGAQ